MDAMGRFAYILVDVYGKGWPIYLQNWVVILR